MIRAGGCLLAACAILFSARAASCRTLQVGPDRELKTAAAAARMVEDGDRVVFDPGEYFDCAIWRANGITIETATPAGADRTVPSDVVFTDLACGRKAAFVIGGNDVTVRGLTFTRVRVPDGNGAGIRAEGRNLTVEHCRFVNNQTSILSIEQPAGALIIRDSYFAGNGACGAGGCLATLAVGHLARLRIERSGFRDPRASQTETGQPVAGPQISSAAEATELVDNRIEDGSGASSALVAFTAAGSLLMTGNVLEKGPRLEDARAAVFAGSGWGHAVSLTFRGNTLVNHTARPGVFLLNWTDASPVLDGNVIGAGDTAVSGRGLWWHRLRYLAASARDGLVSAKDGVRHIGGSVLRGLKSLIRG